jgi:lysophospholipase L1-like esterase
MDRRLKSAGVLWAVAAALLLAGAAGRAAEPGAAEIPVKSGQKIAFLGDSITAGGLAPLGYVSLTVAGLKANGIEAAAIGAGVSGHKSNDMLARLERDVLNRKPDWMTLSCGVNDVWHGARGVPLDQYKTNITAIVDKAQAAGIKVMILTATVIGEDLANPNNGKLAAYNDFLRELAREKKCLLADLNADFQQIIKASAKPGNVLTGDGVHMNAAGNQAMARGILRAFGLSEGQLAKAGEFWLDMPGAVELKPALQGSVKLTLRQQQRLEAVAAKHKLTVAQLAARLYGAELSGGGEAKTAAEIEAFLDKADQKDPAAVLQEGFARRVEELLK